MVTHSLSAPSLLVSLGGRFRVLRPFPWVATFSQNIDRTKQVVKSLESDPGESRVPFGPCFAEDTPLRTFRVRLGPVASRDGTRAVGATGAVPTRRTTAVSHSVSLRDTTTLDSVRQRVGSPGLRHPWTSRARLIESHPERPCGHWWSLAVVVQIECTGGPRLWLFSGPGATLPKTVAGKKRK